MEGKTLIYRKIFSGKPLLHRPGPRGGAVLLQKLFNFKTLRGGKGAAEAGAFQSCRSGRKSQRLPQLLALGDRQREGAMEDVAGAQRIHGVECKGGRLQQVSVRARSCRAGRASLQEMTA